jgi:hypothetical protein
VLTVQAWEKGTRCFWTAPAGDERGMVWTRATSELYGVVSFGATLSGQVSRATERRCGFLDQGEKYEPSGIRLLGGYFPEDSVEMQ